MAKNEASETAVTESPEQEAPDAASELVAEIDAAVADVVKSRSGEDDEAAKPEADEGEGEPAPEERDEAPEPDKAEGRSRDEKGRFAESTPKDETIERAVKAGLSLADAKKFPTDALLAATCDRIEGVQKAQAGEAKPAGEKGGGEAEPADPLAAIPDLDPSEFDERIVKSFSAVKEVAKNLQRTIDELRGDRSKGFVATKLEGLKNLTKGDASKEAAVRAKFDVLTAGYKAAKQDVSEEEVFAEAAQLVLGAEAAADKQAKQAEVAAKRSGQRISRPSGRNVEAKPDVLEQVAAEIDRKFFAAR